MNICLGKAKQIFIEKIFFERKYFNIVAFTLTIKILKYRHLSSVLSARFFYFVAFFL